MVKRRLFPALVIALTISGLFTWWISSKVSRPVKAQTVATRSIVAVTTNVAAGQLLDPSSLQLIAWPSAQPMPGAFESIAELKGRTLLLPLTAGEIVLAHQLAAPGSGSGLVGRVPPGMRALTLHSDEIAGGITFLVPGSLVDVLATFRNASVSGMQSATVLQNIRVLAIGDSLDPTADAKSGSSPTVTLLVTPESAERLTLAASLGKIVFILRNGSDDRDVPELDAAFPTQEEPAPPKQIAPKSGPTPALAHQSLSSGFTVETIAGTKRTEQTFGGGTE